MNLKSLLVSTSFVSLVFAGCAVDSPETAPGGDPVTEPRHALGKADNVGSCQAGPFDLCDGKGTGTCWCDELCHDFGDCCSDKVQLCGGGEQPQCDMPPDVDAYYVIDNPATCAAAHFICDEGYAPFFNPCGCGCIEEQPDPEPAGCGGFLGLSCDEGEYCDYVDGSCGIADQMGTCKALPDACIQLVAPVCGCDGQTYGNVCEAATAGASVAKEGSCDPPPPEPCGGCSDGYDCQYCWGGFACVPEGALC